MSYPILLTAPALANLQWVFDSAVASTTSPYTFKRTTSSYGSSRLRAICTTPPMSYELSLRWMGFFAKLQQTGEPFMFGPGPWQNVSFPRQGQVPGNPVLTTRHSSGDVFDVRGLLTQTQPATYQSQTFSAGWFFEIEDDTNTKRLFMLKSTRSNTDEGRAEFDVFPSISHTFNQGKWLHFTNPRGLFRVINYPTFNYGANRILLPLTFEVAGD